MSQPQRIMFTGPGQAELQGYDTLQPGPGQLLIQTQVSLISPGTERAFFLGLPNTTRNYPSSTGYSNVGTVIAIGPDVSDSGRGWQVGDLAANPGFHGALVAVDQARCVRVPDGLSPEDAVFYHLLTIALQGVRRAHIELGETVAVLGAGLVGLLAAQIVRASGGAPIVTLDPEARRHPYARQSGSDQVLTAWNDANDLPPVVIEATGHPDAIVDAMQLAAPGGRVVLLGSTRGETEQVNFYRDVHRKGLTVIGAHNAARPAYESRPGCWTQADDSRAVMRLLELGRLQVGHLITHRFAWQQALDAFALLKAWDANALGILLDWSA
jgi:L-iditol 2-dehydrogenase